MSASGIVNALFLAYEFVLVARVALSWVEMSRSSAVARIVYLLTDPPVLLCREIIHGVAKIFRANERSLPVDFSPLLAFLIVDIVVRRVALVIVHLMAR